MDELFEGPLNMMEQTVGLWRQMPSNPPWLTQPNMTFAQCWAPWLAGARATTQLNNSAWNIFFNQFEAVFLAVVQECPWISDAVRTQIAESWEAVKKTQETQQDAAHELLIRVDRLLARKP